MAHKTYLSGLAFIAKIVLDGERDFSNIKLQEGFDFSQDKDALGALKAYAMKEHSFFYRPLDLRNSDFHYVRFDVGGLILAKTRGSGVDFSGSSFRELSFHQSDLTRAKFDEIKRISEPGSGKTYLSLVLSRLTNASFQMADLRGAFFNNSDLTNANMRYANLENANLHQADLRETQGLESAISLGKALYLNTKVNEKEAKIIRHAVTKDLLKIMDSEVN